MSTTIEAGLLGGYVVCADGEVTAVATLADAAALTNDPWLAALAAAEAALDAAADFAEELL